MAAVTHYADFTNGNNATLDGTNPLTPYKNLSNAVTGGTNGDDLTVILADDTYIENNANTGSGVEYAFLAKALASLTVQSTTTLGATIQSDAAYTNRVMHVASMTSYAQFEDIIIDQRDTNTVGVSGSVTDIRFVGTLFKDIKGSIMAGGWTTLANLEFSGGWEFDIASTSSFEGVVASTATASSTYDISDGSVTSDAAVAITGGVFNLTCTGASSTLTIHDVTCNPTMNASSDGGARFCKFSGFATASVYGNTINPDMTLTDNTGMGIDVVNSSVACTSLNIYSNSIIGGTATTRHQYGIKVGDEATSANDNSISGVNVFGNTLTGVNHGLMAGFVTGAKFNGNLVRYATIGCLSKGGTSNVFTGNILIEPGTGTSYTLYGKGDTTSQFCNNVLIYKVTNPTTVMFANFNLTTGVDDSTGTVFSNNIIRTDVATMVFCNTSATSTATITYNCLYSSVAQTNEFAYQGTTYDTLAAFETAVGTANNNIVTDPAFNDYDNEDFTLPSTSPCYRTGTRYWGTSGNPTGYDGEPFSDLDTDMGAYQSKHGSFHPINL